MQAAVLKAFATPLAVETLPDPVPGPGEAVVDILAAPVLAYAGEVFSGARKYLLELPQAPGSGAIARVRALGPDATRLAAGDYVFCDPTVRSRDDAHAPDIMLQGLTAGSEAALTLQRHFRHGSFAERMRLPLENAHPIGTIEGPQAPRWSALGRLLVPYGGFLAAGLEAGETVLVNGATGSFGSAGVMVALAMGAARVVATGRNVRVLEALRERFGPRVAAVPLTGTEAEDRARMLAAASGAIDCVLDILPPAADPRMCRTAVLCVRPHGRVALMGGVGMQGGADLELPYSWLMRNNVVVRGQWMYPREAPGRLVALVRAGLLDLGHFEVASFPLVAANEAVAHAAANAGAFKLTVICP